MMLPILIIVGIIGFGSAVVVPIVPVLAYVILALIIAMIMVIVKNLG
jgi:hypothetical protein